MKTETNPPIAEAASLIVKLAEALKVQRIMNVPGPWVYRWPDDTWAVAANGHSEKAIVKSEGLMEIELPPYHFAIWKNGWLLGLMTPFDGGFLVGPNGSTEDEFIEAIKAHTKTLMPSGSREPLKP